MRQKITLLSVLLSVLLLGACGQSNQSDQEFLTEFDGKLEHVHGIGYMGEKGIAFASHDGLKFYKEKTWYATTDQNNDYMGFNVVDKGFYTSGHPGKGSKLPNPLGIQKSSDDGKNLSDVAFEGDFDFHSMGVGDINHAIYVYNGHGNTQLSSGLHKTLDEGDSWERVKGEGINGEIVAIAVHPTNEKMIAVTTKNGVYLSEDGGEKFLPLEENVNGTAVYFSENKLWYGTFYSKPQLTTYDLEEETKEQISLPKLGQDAVAYFDKKQESDEMVIYTYQNHAYITKNKGEKWSQIVTSGKVD
ncbi:F510_1955 family glycosylhydrolase [Pontibacillus sp. HMF3514]|uniref:F510_1955 family glycosylhydrolase n=1 Tax=Pontibacillus sp. HMF3514 TaxID=2692425 RepID=UPI00131F9476|nr:hypothetical protein [Pontibacillus sp. HMF3514]QHE52363.1 hypothetical protein GS400_10080 [Pontibacillus sp. HMF3514]